MRSATGPKACPRAEMSQIGQLVRVDPSDLRFLRFKDAALRCAFIEDCLTGRSGRLEASLTWVFLHHEGAELDGFQQRCITE